VEDYGSPEANVDTTEAPNRDDRFGW